MNLSQNIKAFFIGKITVSLILTWTMLIAISGSWNFFQNHQDTISKARIEANTIFQHNLAYRKWSTMHGGIYTRISVGDQKNPHLILPLTGNSGQVSFSLVDPAQMTKQAYDVLHKQAPALAAINRTVSLDFKKSMDPYDEPDDWEKNALLTIHEQNNLDELSTVMEINEKPYLRLLKPYVIDKGCQKCHSTENFRIGDVRAGMSVAVPMDPYYDIATHTYKTIFFTHLILWLLGCLAIIRFAAAFKKYRRTIIENEEKFRIVSEFAYNFEYWVKADNTLAFISPSCERLTGYSREEFMQNPKILIDIIHPEDVDHFRRHIQEVDAPCHEGSEYRIITKDGTVRWFSHTCSPININGNFLGRRSSSVDITEHKELENQLQKAKQLEYLGQFAGGIAHDFNNVLGSINTFTHLIFEEVKDSNKIVVDYIKYIKIAAKLGKNMTSNLLSFGKRQIIKPQQTTLNVIVTNIADILKTLVDEETNYRYNLTEDDLEISADPHQLEQILINLCTNARDAMRNKGSGGTITITTKAVSVDAPIAGCLEMIPDRQFMTLSVADTGDGITPHNLVKICEPFFTTKDASKGTGLGMSIIFNIVKQHNAYLDIQSELGVGSIFTIYFPTAQKQQLKTPPKEQSHSQTSNSTKQETSENNLKPHSDKVVHSPQGHAPDSSPEKISSATGATILLVDDDELIRKSLSLPLERLGYNIILAENGKKAISQYIDKKELIDLIILDVILPHKNGKEVFDIIRKDNEHIKVIFISGYTDNIISEDTLNLPNVHFIAKPVDLEKLLATISRLTTS